MFYPPGLKKLLIYKIIIYKKSLLYCKKQDVLGKIRSPKRARVAIMDVNKAEQINRHQSLGISRLVPASRLLGCSFVGVLFL